MYTLCLVHSSYYDVTSGNNFDCEKVHEDNILERQHVTFCLRRIQRLWIRKIPKYEIGTLMYEYDGDGDSVPRSTMYLGRVRIFEEWQAARQNKLVMSKDNPFSLYSIWHSRRRIRWIIKRIYDWSEFDNQVQRNIAPEQLMHVVEQSFQ